MPPVLGDTYQHFDPFKIHFPFFFSAFVFIDTTSDPAFGSDMASDPTCSPDRRGPRYFFRCSSASTGSDMPNDLRLDYTHFPIE